MSVEQLYSKEVNERRKLAKRERKKLRDNGENGKMFIKFPANLMLKPKNDSRYKLHSEY